MITIYKTDEEFHNQRRKTVGSSDIPTLLGLNAKYDQTAFTLWQEKTGRKSSFVGNKYTEWGHRLEPVILAKFLEDFSINEKFTPMQKTCAIHSEYTFALAHADLWIPEIKRIQEAKSGSFYGTQRKDDPDRGYSRDNLTSNGIPISVYCQTIWQMLCYDAELCGVSALMDTSTYLEYGPWERDPKLEGKLLEIADKFMWHVMNDTPPMPMTWNDVQELFPKINDTACVYPLDYKLNENELTIGDMIEAFHVQSEQKRKAEEKLDDIKKAIGILMGENRVMQTPDGIVLVTMASIEKETPKGIKEIRKHFPDFADKLIEAGLVSQSKYKKPTVRKIKD